MPNHPALTRVAIIGAGLAGLSCADHLAQADVEVTVFDRSRGVGGRMATRRARWTDAAGAEREASFDHGCPAFTARSEAFRDAVLQARARGWLLPWNPRPGPASYEALEPETLWLPTPAATRWCRQLAEGLPVRCEHRVGALHRGGAGWSLEFDAGVHRAEGFSHVVVAVPPAQAAPLFEPHRPDWAVQAARWPMLPCWTLMGVAAAEPQPVPWDVLRPRSGPVSWLARNEAKPGREGPAGHHLWVAHAGAEWSHTHLDAPEAEVRALLQQAVAQLLGQQPRWQAAWVHRWRHAHGPRAATTARGRACWLDLQQALGACGDYLGGSGVEGAWLSGRALAETLLSSLDAAAPQRAGRRVR